MRPLHRKRKICYSRERYQQDTLYKKRKFSDHSLVVTSDGGFSSESVCNSPEKGINVDKNVPATMFHGGIFLPYYLDFFYIFMIFQVSGAGAHWFC